MTKTLFLKLYEPKNPLFLEGVLKPIGIQPLNDASVIQNSIRKEISLDLPEIDDDDISSPEPIEPPTPKPFKLLEPLVPRPLEPITIRSLKPPKPENRPVEKPMKPIDSSNLDKMQLNLVISLCYRIKAKIFKKKLDKNNFTPNTYK